MNKLYAFIGLIVVCVGSISGCKTLLDVTPKGIYSPIELDAKLIPQKISEKACKVLFVGTDASLNYGALVFYDSLLAASFVHEGKTIGQVQVVTAVRSSTAATNQFTSDTIKFDNTKGQYLFVTPFAYKSEDSVAVRTKQDYRKVFASQGYMQLKISPWTHVTDLPGSTFSGVPTIFPANKNLACVKYDAYNTKFIYGYEYDTLANKWTDKGSFKNEFCQGRCQSRNPSVPTTLFATGVIKGYYANNEYHLLTSLYLSGEGFLLRYGLGEVVADQNFAFKSYGTNSFYSTPSFYSLTDIQGDRVRMIYNSPNTLPTGNAYVTGGYSASLTANARTFYSTKESIIPSVACVVGNKLVANSVEQSNTFSVYDLEDSSLKKLVTVAYSDRNKIWFTEVGSPSVLTISQGDHAFILNNLLNIYRVTLKATNEPVFTSIYTGWFPATSAASFNRALLYGDKLWFLVNNYELWTINPDQTTINFTRPGAVTIVTL